MGSWIREVAPLIADSIKHFTEIGPASNYLVRLLCKYGVSNFEMAADLLDQLIRTVNGIPYADEDLRKLIESFCQKQCKRRRRTLFVSFLRTKGPCF